MASYLSTVLSPMPFWILPCIAILAGFVGLVWSADRFVEGSATIAGNLGVSRLVIGLTIVAFGTSAPEVLVSISSSLKSAGELAVGNALGSNLANIGLVLGVTAVLAPLPVKGHILKQEFVVMLGVMAIAGWFLLDSQLTSLEGLLLIILLLPLMAWIGWSRKHHPEEVEELEMLTIQAGILWFSIGLTALIASAEILVWGAQQAALGLGVSPLIIGLTVVAVGTSLPELAASVISALKGHHDIAIGNVIGSNMFNLLLVMGIAPVIQPIAMGAEVFWRDFLAMSAITLVLGAVMLCSYLLANNGYGRVGRFPGMVLLLLYVGYYTLLL